METESKKIVMFDMDMTLVDSSIARQYGRDYKEVQKHISEFSIYDGIKEIINQLSNQYAIYVVSGNVGSTVKKVIQHFHLNVPLENIYGYRQGYPMDNLARKKKVLQVAIDSIMHTHPITKSDIIYIGDEVDDYKACKSVGIKFIGCTWGNSELNNTKGITLINNPQHLISLL